MLVSNFFLFVAFGICIVIGMISDMKKSPFTLFISAISTSAVAKRSYIKMKNNND